MQELGLVKDVTYTKSDEPAARNRYIYYPDRLNRLPAETPGLGDMFSLWRSGILAGVYGVLTEPMRPKRPHSMTDETVGSFLERRVDKRMANNIVSAVFHGIYAGDIWQLSAKTLLALAWQLEGKYGSAMGGFFRLQTEDQRPENFALAKPYDLESIRAMNDEIDLDVDFLKELRASSTFTFKEGLGQLVRALQDSVEKKGNIEIKVGTMVQATDPVQDGSLQIAVTSGVCFDTACEQRSLTMTRTNPRLRPKTTTSSFQRYATSHSPHT